MFGVAEWVLKSHPNLLGCGIAFVPDFYPEKGRLFEPYAYRTRRTQDDEGLEMKQIANHMHDYTKMGFYKVTISRKKPFWSYPYYNDLTNSRIVTYCMPVHHQKNIVAVFGLDIDTKWLGDTLNYRHIYPSSYNFLLTETGKLIAGPNQGEEERKNTKIIIDQINDSTVKKSLSKSGRSYVFPIKDADGDKGLVFYTNFKGKPKWQIAVVCYDKEVYAKLNKMRTHIGILMLLGLLVLGLIIIRFAKNDHKLHKANMEKERIGSELRIATNIQKEMLPKAFLSNPKRDDIDICGMLIPAREVGGDLYDYFIRDEKLFFCIGDVSGKGVPSAMVMAVIHSLFRMASAHENNPARIMQTINETACQGNESNMFVTLFVGVLDLPTGHLRYSNAGHDCPMIMANGQWSMLNANANLPVGIFDDMKYSMQEILIQPDSTIFLYTDGLTEAKNERHEQFGIDRVKEVLSYSNSLSPKGVMEKMTTAVHVFVGDAEQSDDLTMLAICYTPVHLESVLDEQLTLLNDIHQVKQLNAFVKQIMERLSIEKSLARQLQLAVEEAVVNVMEYAYPTETNGEITIKMTSDSHLLRIQIIDAGVYFDPTAKEKADIDIPVQERQIGGLGILLVRELMDTINYEREDGKNILTLIKKLP